MRRVTRSFLACLVLAALALVPAAFHAVATAGTQPPVARPLLVEGGRLITPTAAPLDDKPHLLVNGRFSAVARR
jgi:hypothetical protein